MSRSKLAIGDRVIASLQSKVVGTIVATNQFNEVLVEWPDGTHWVKRRHLMLEIELDLLENQK